MLGNGSAYCWGVNGFLQLGTGNTNERDSIPRPVAGGLAFTAITAGETHSCALTATGNAYCWGVSNSGALGSGATNRSAVPVPVAGGHTFKAIDAGRGFTCGLTTAGAAYCWGIDDWGQLGRDTTQTDTPVAVTGDHTFTSIAVGDYNACGIVAGGDAYCWGHNALGTLGTGDTSALIKHPLPERVAGGLHFKAIAIGDVHACALTTTGNAYCWGGNLFGQLGDGTRTDEYAPWAVLTNLTFASLAVGTSHTCALAETGDLYCWGSNVAAQLGGPATSVCSVGTLAPCALRPIPAAEGHVFRSVTAGVAQTCAIERNGGGAFCWGANNQGQVGIGTVSATVVAVTHVADP